MLKLSCKQPPVDISQLTPEDRQFFGKYIHDLQAKDKWITLEEAQYQAYQMVCVKTLMVLTD